MKILLDECLPLDFRHSFPSHDAHTAQWAGFKGKKNGDLLRAAEAAGYEVMLTVDQGIPLQTSLTDGSLAIIVLRARTNQIEDLRRWCLRFCRPSDRFAPAKSSQFHRERGLGELFRITKAALARKK